MTDCTTTTPPDYSAVPAALRDVRQWLCWKLEQKPGAKKPAKMPAYASGKRRTGAQGSDADRAALVSFDDAVKAMSKLGATGIGFAFLPGSDRIGLDLDRAVDPETGEINPRAQRIIDACNSYTEWSPSGTGFHIYLLGETNNAKDNGAGIEVFCTSQFFTVTGRHLTGTPAEVRRIDAKVLRRLHKTIAEAKGGFSDKPAPASKAAPLSPASERERALSALAAIDPGIGYSDWLQIGMALHAALGGEGLSAWDAWSARSDKYPGAAVIRQHWDSFKPGAVKGGTLFHFAQLAGWVAPRARKPENKRADHVKSGPAGPAGGRAVTGFTSAGRRFIRHDAGRQPEVLDAIGLALGEATNLNLFDHGGRLTRIYVTERTADGAIHRPKGALVLHQVDATHLGELATSAAVHEKYDSRSGEDKLIDCPRRAAEAYVARGYHKEIRPLYGFSETPLVTADGGLIDTPGYDVGTQIFLALDGRIADYKSPPRRPSREDAIRATTDVLLAAVETFPFVSENDRAGALAAIITAVECRVLPARPMFPITAPTPGTGKSLLADTFAIIACGRQASVLSLGHDDAEAEKRLGGAYLAGDQVINIDNVERSIGGDLLCQATSQSSLRLRPLGSSGMLSVPTNSMLLATGNNIQIRGDLKRRVCMIRLDAKQERPEHRKFSRNHLEYVAAHRGALIRAALTIPLAYMAAGAPDLDLPPLGGFDLWDKLVRRPLVWLGLPDPLAASEGLRESDPDLENMRQFLFECTALYKSASFTAAEVVADAVETLRDASGKSTGVPIHAALRDAVRAVCRDKPSSSQLGYWLRAHRDRISDGMYLTRDGADGHAKVTRWKVVSTAGDAGDCG